MSATTQFLSPYQMEKTLEGVLLALPVKRPNWVQKFFTDAGSTEKDTVNFDQEYGTKNVMGMFVDPKADVTPIKLPNYGHKELTFAYSKEAIDSDEYEQLVNRQIGEQFGQVDILRNKAQRFIKKVALAEQRFENLFELCSVRLALYGAYVAESQLHQKVYYNFGRTKATVWSEIKGDNALQLIPSVNLTTSAVTAPWDSSETILPVVATSGGDYTAGEKAWNKTTIDAGTATPVADVYKMIQTCNERATASAIHMSDDAYQWFEYDLTKNYKDAATTTILTLQSVSLKVMPTLEVIKGLTFRRTFILDNGISVPIYTYNGVYNDRTTGTETKYIGSGWVVVFPDDGGIKKHGRIKHPKANWQAMPRWMNYWQNQKTGEEEWEIHTNFLFGHTGIDSLVAWKVA